MTGKTALRAVWQAEITLDDVRVPAENKLANCHSFKDVSAGARPHPVHRRLAGAGPGDRLLRARAGARPAARAVRPADRRLPAGAGQAGPDARRDHLDAADVLAAVEAGRRRPDDRGDGLAGQDEPRREGPGDRRRRPRHPRRRRDPARQPRGPAPRRHGGDLHLRGHRLGAGADRRPGDHRPLGDQRPQAGPAERAAPVASAHRVRGFAPVVAARHSGQAVRPPPTRAHFCDPHTWTIAPQTASSTSPSSSAGAGAPRRRARDELFAAVLLPGTSDPGGRTPRRTCPRVAVPRSQPVNPVRTALATESRTAPDRLPALPSGSHRPEGVGAWIRSACWSAPSCSPSGSWPAGSAAVAPLLPRRSPRCAAAATRSASTTGTPTPATPSCGATPTTGAAGGPGHTWVPCTCRQYVGPRPIDEVFAPRLLPPSPTDAGGRSPVPAAPSAGAPPARGHRARRALVSAGALAAAPAAAAAGSARGGAPGARAAGPARLRRLHPGAAHVAAPARLSRRGLGAGPQPRPHAGGGRRTAAAGRPAGRASTGPGEHRRAGASAGSSPGGWRAGPAPGAAGHLAGLAVPLAGRRRDGSPGARVYRALLAPARADRRPRARRPLAAAAAGAEHRGLLALGRRRRLAGLPSGDRADAARTSPSGPATSAWATTPPSSGWSPTGWPSRGTTGSRSTGPPGSGSAPCSPED